jgi:hypothetical protein
MSLYSDSVVKTRYLDPKIYVPSVRCSFDLDNTEAAYLPNLRLTMIGAKAPGGGTYASLPGAVGGLIRNIRLMDGKVELSAKSEFGFFRGFQNQNRTNAQAQALGTNLHGSAVGRTIDGATRKIAQNVLQNEYGATLADSEAGAGWLDLREVFPILNSMTHLPTSVFENLRIEVEFNKVASLNNLGNTADPLFETLRPVLAADVIENPAVVGNLNKTLGTIMWNEIEHDQFVIPAGVGLGAGGIVAAAGEGAIQPLNVKLNGFNNKIVDRVLLVKELASWATQEATGTNVQKGFGRWSSQACYKQVIQFRINGGNIVPRNGIVADNERLAFLLDTWGDCANYTTSNIYGATDASAILGLSGGVPATAENYWIGQLDYVGCYIGQYISDFQFDFQRTGLQNGAGKNATSDALIGHMYGEVRKTLQFQANGQYLISYVQ